MRFRPWMDSDCARHRAAGPGSQTAREKGKAMTGRMTAGVSVALGLWIGAGGVRADDGWSPTSAPPAVVRARAVVATSRPAVPVSLGRPVATAAVPRPVASLLPPTAPLTPASFQRPAEPVAVSAPRGGPVFRGQAPDTVGPPGGGAVPPPPVGTEPFNNGAVLPPPPPAGGGGNFWEKGWQGFTGTFQRRSGQLFQSDHGGDFDQFASPVTSPFLTVDPRALTEVKPIFLYQTIPNKNDVFRGGNVEFFGLSGSIAFTERWSLVLNKMGGIFIQPNDKTFTNGQDANSFSELWLGPKYTFYRDECNKSVAAAGLTFQIPAGNQRAFQNTGSLSLAPYFSFAKGFGNFPGGFGNFNYMSTTGFSVATDNQRSDYFYSNFHLDFDVAGQHKFYPLIELNWTRYLSSGGATPFFSEGGDLANFGAANVSHRNLVTLATGARYKFSEHVQTGAAFEFPLTNARDLNDFRFTIDLILRY